MTTKAWGNLTTSDMLVCPGDGRAEQVVRVERRKDGTVFVRTSRHDHFRKQDARAETQQETAPTIHSVLYPRCPACRRQVAASHLTGWLFRLHRHGAIDSGECTGSGRWMNDKEHRFLAPRGAERCDRLLAQRGGCETVDVMVDPDGEPGGLDWV